MKELERSGEDLVFFLWSTHLDRVNFSLFNGLERSVMRHIFVPPAKAGLPDHAGPDFCS